MPLFELEIYNRQKRRYDFEAGNSIKHIKIRKEFYGLFCLFLKLDRLLSRKQTIRVIGEKPNLNSQYIFACTHIWENDLENIYEVLGKGCWWFVGDPGFLYKDISGLLLALNGRIYADLTHRDDCHIAFLNSVELLNKGGSLMIFPEGARNGTENIPVMKLFPGVARMSKQTGVQIMPVAVEQYGKDFWVSFGEGIKPEERQSIEELTDLLRERMATLKWELWERKGIYCRKDIAPDYREKYHKEFESKLYPYDTLETNMRARYKTSEDLEHEQVLADIKRLQSCMSTINLCDE